MLRKPPRGRRSGPPLTVHQLFPIAGGQGAFPQPSVHLLSVPPFGSFSPCLLLAPSLRASFWLRCSRLLARIAPIAVGDPTAKPPVFRRRDGCRCSI